MLTLAAEVSFEWLLIFYDVFIITKFGFSVSACSTSWNLSLIDSNKTTVNNDYVPRVKQ